MTAEQAVEAAKGMTFEKVWTAMNESNRRIEKNIAELSKNIGGLGNSLGHVIEAMFKNEIWKKFNDIGFPVTRQSERVKFGDCNKRVLTEVDLLIENGEYAIAVEIKTDMKIEFVNDHIERIEIVRRYLDEHGDKRKLIGAVAGGNIPESVLKYAQKQGFYVVLQNGDSVSIADAPQGFKAREWLPDMGAQASPPAY